MVEDRQEQTPPDGTIAQDGKRVEVDRRHPSDRPTAGVSRAQRMAASRSFGQ
jgi:hypothetical protein